MAEFFISALTLFSLRVVDISFYTIRILMVVRGRKGLAWLFGFCQAFVYVIAIRAVLADMGNWGKMIGYAAGFATGMLIGMWVEGKLAIGYTHLRIISIGFGQDLTEHLRNSGYAVTEVPAHGKDGVVDLLVCDVLRRKTGEVVHIVTDIDPGAFITAESVRSVRRGFWGG
jgi:uncharacterized protein YebE (UPF0316 family)